jgi:hypothetical protein
MRGEFCGQEKEREIRKRRKRNSNRQESPDFAD